MLVAPPAVSVLSHLIRFVALTLTLRHSTYRLPFRGIFSKQIPSVTPRGFRALHSPSVLVSSWESTHLSLFVLFDVKHGLSPCTSYRLSFSRTARSRPLILIIVSSLFVLLSCVRAGYL